MKQSIIEDCIKHFKSIDVDAYQEHDSSVYVAIGFEVYVQISDAEVIFSAERFNEEINE